MQHKKSAPVTNEKGKENKSIESAHKQAERDIETDPDLQTEPRPADDLDEGELARLEGEE